MKRVKTVLATLVIPLAACSEAPTVVPSTLPPIEVHTDCPVPPVPPDDVVDIVEANPEVDKHHHDEMLRKLVTSIRTPGVTVRLGPNVVLDFSEAMHSQFVDLFTPGQPLLDFAACVTLTSVSSFEPGKAPAPQARSPTSRGPLLNFGPHRENVPYFIRIWCQPDDPLSFDDGVRISGFRIHGPSFAQQSTGEVAIKIFRCSNIEISNMEIAGWGEAAIRVQDQTKVDDQLVPDQGPAENPTNHPGGRISNASQVKILNNFIHHNQYPAKTTCTGPPSPFQSCTSHAAGYGVDVTDGAFALVSENVFDFNRHAIAASGNSGGYDAIRNLVLKGGGYHGRWYNTYTHIFDVHGTGCWWSSDLCGDAGGRFSYVDNAFQYRNDNAIKIRGRPRELAFISGNVFPHDGLEDDWGDDAIHLQTSDNVVIGMGNISEFDAYGHYGVCDFDGDRLDDLFLPTRASWWYSSSGSNHWTYLNDPRERLDQLRLGYFDDDLSCDVLTESGREWVISSGGRGAWTSIGAFGKPLSEVAFGQFDPNRRDHRAGASRRTTHAFWRAPNGQWFVTPLSAADWRPVQSSERPLNELRFGDFTGDGVTDVLAVADGRWAISESARSPWRNLNPHLSNDVSSLFIADLDNNNIDDIIRLESRKIPQAGGGFGFMNITWWASDDGRSEWRKLKTYSFQYNVLTPALYGFVGRFGAALGADVLVTDPGRMGHFFSERQAVSDSASASWQSRSAY